MRKEYAGFAKQYKIDTPVTYTYLAVASLLFWITGYACSIGYPVYSDGTSLPLWNTIGQWLPNRTLTYLAGLLLMAGGAFLIHRANYLLMIIREKTFLPFLLYILFISSNYDFIPLKPTSGATFCLVLAMYQLFTSYHDPKSVFKAYNTALILGAGSLVWVHILWFFPLFWLAMYNFKSLSLRTFLASLLGLLTVYWLLLGVCFYLQDYTSFTLPFVALSKMHIHVMENLDPMNRLLVFYAAFLLLVSSVYIITHSHDDIIRARQYLYFLIGFSVLSFILSFLYEQSANDFLNIASISGSVLVAHFFTVRGDRKRAVFFHIVMFLFIALSVVRLWSFLSNTVI